MIKKTKDAYKRIAEIIRKALDYNKNVEEGYTPIKLTSIEISRGLMNQINKNDEFMTNVYADLSLAYGDEFEWRTKDNDDMGCFLFITHK